MQNMAEKAGETTGLFFGICEACFWCASLTNPARSISLCPMCSSNGVTLIPLAQNESYRYNITEKRGLDIRFATCRKSSNRSTNKSGQALSDVC